MASVEPQPATTCRTNSRQITMEITGRTIGFIHANDQTPDEATQTEILAPICDFLIQCSNNGYQAGLAEINQRLSAGDTLAIVTTNVFHISTTTLIQMFEDLFAANVAMRICQPDLVVDAKTSSDVRRLITHLHQHSTFYHRLKTGKAAQSRAKSGPQPKLSEDQLPKIRKLMHEDKLSGEAVAKLMNVSRATLFNFLRKHRHQA